MMLCAHQPAYLPWLGYFDKIMHSDIFIFLDTVQFEKNSYVNRNKIKGPNGIFWLTIPIKQREHLYTPLNEILIDNSKNWKHKHLTSIMMCYKKALFFHINYQKLLDLYNNKNYTKLVDLCWDQLIFWMKEFHITTKIVKLSELHIKEKNQILY